MIINIVGVTLIAFFLLLSLASDDEVMDAALLAYPIGILLYNLGLFAYMFLETSLLYFLLLPALFVSLYWINYKKILGHFTARNSLNFLLFFVAFASVALFLYNKNIIALSFDSYDVFQKTYYFQKLPKLTGNISVGVGMGNLPIFIPAALTLNGFVDLKISSLIISLFYLMGFLLLIRMSYLMLRRSFALSKWVSLSVSLLVALIIASTKFIFFQAFYINGNLVTGVYLLIFFFGVWYTQKTGPSSLWFWSAVLSLVAFATLRLEAAFFASMFVFAMSFESEPALSKEWKFGLLLIALFYTVYGSLIYHSANAQNIASPARTLLMIAALDLTIILCIFKKYLPQKIQAIFSSPAFMPFILLLAASLIYWLNKEAFVASFQALTKNLGSVHMWGGTWYLVLSVLCLSFFQKSCRLFSVVILSFFMMVLLLGGIREIPFRLGWGDSANRMMTHILFTSGLLITMYYGTLANKIKTKFKWLG